MPTHSNAYKWLSSIAWEAFTGRLETATCCCFFLVECGIMQACIIDTVNILLSKCLVIVGSDTMLKPPSPPLKKSRFWRHWVSDMKCEESQNGWESRSLLSLPISSFSLCSPLGTHFFFFGLLQALNPLYVLARRQSAASGEPARTTTVTVARIS